jgi:hypothetical protein
VPGQFESCRGPRTCYQGALFDDIPEDLHGGLGEEFLFADEDVDGAEDDEWPGAPLRDVSSGGGGASSFSLVHSLFGKWSC